MFLTCLVGFHSLLFFLSIPPIVIGIQVNVYTPYSKNLKNIINFFLPKNNAVANKNATLNTKSINNT